MAEDFFDMRISGGADIIHRYLNAWLADEFCFHAAPLLPGNGLPLFENILTEKFSVKVHEAFHPGYVARIVYKVCR